MSCPQGNVYQVKYWISINYRVFSEQIHLCKLMESTNNTRCKQCNTSQETHYVSAASPGL
jgi:hypothetical protein